MTEKYKETIFTALGNPSCSKGWLRWIVQLFFGIIIVSSFTLILLMSLKTRPSKHEQLTRCRIHNCRVVCFETPYYEKYENDIVEAAWQTNAICPTIVLTLQRPHFPNGTLPQNWLSKIRSHVNELAIIDGNLNHIPHRAFNTHFSSKLDTLILEKVGLSSWEPETFMGLTGLKQLYIKDCVFKNVTRNALQAVDDTLEFLDIKAGFEWNPRNITGSADLKAISVVDFSLNPFYSILDKFSFSQIRMCKILHLNSCRISYLGLGTFDPLDYIEKIYLNDNYLVAVSDGLFRKIILRTPRIALHDNLWYCNCSFTDIRQLSSSGLIIVDPICRHPEHLRGHTFSDFNHYCKRNEKPQPDLELGEGNEVNDHESNNETHTFHINGVCYNSTCQVFRVDSDVYNNGCRLNRLKIDEMTRADGSNLWPEAQDSDWLSLTFSVRSNQLSIVELLPKNLTTEHGLLWFESSCPEDVYCINSIPDVLKIFDQRYGVQYTFCLFDLRSSIIKSRQCISYKFPLSSDVKEYSESKFMIIGFTILSIICLICGAICVYALIQRNPNLLKGNKRIVFVKHKEINALILPPKVPLRSFDHSNDDNLGKKIFFVTTHQQSVSNLERSESFSPSSNEVSYISALQPTQEQLTQWRKKQSLKSPYKSPTDFNFSNIFNNDSLPYYSLNEKIYDTPYDPVRN
ncbi:unnamed protein product [Pieris macdunnoughi]|uniref:Uncharacterized protein n=1 Tax=Pieris macdunnoughi TaxID=345717 RepID=A0A821XGW6_9NEOP|nr:unnamed protein product [Pieris macdunnoughi]